MGAALFYQVEDGQEKAILNMPKKSSDTECRQKLKQIVGLLKFIKSIDDEEIVKSTIESIIEILEEELDK